MYANQREVYYHNQLTVLICAIRDSMAIRSTPHWSDIEKLDAQEGIGIGCLQWVYESPWKYPAKTHYTLGGDVVRMPTLSGFWIIGC